MCSKILEYTEKVLEGTSYLSSKILQEVVFAFEILLVLCLSCYNEIELLKKPLWLGNAHTHSSPEWQFSHMPSSLRAILSFWCYRSTLLLVFNTGEG